MKDGYDFELLSPAGCSDAFKAAVLAGANAIYFGVEQFNARRRAENIKITDISSLVNIASRYGIKTYLTVNILLFDQEIQAALDVVQSAVDQGISGVIIQDLGFASVVHKKNPTLEMHASTQLTTHNIEQCRFLIDSGFSQINLSRELSLSEIKSIADFLRSKNVRPEIFVHGAFCISYSGQCYLSHYLYGEAGNRGECVQPCRREYFVNFKKIKNPLNRNQYIQNNPVSPFNLKDNCLFPDAEKLCKIVPNASFKIEGRIKSPQYVWAVTSAWRDQLDRVDKGSACLSISDNLTLSMNRGLTDGYLNNNISTEMFSSGSKDESIQFIGRVISYKADLHCLIVMCEKTALLETNDKIIIKEANDVFICTALIESIQEPSASIQNQKNEAIQICLIRITGKLAGLIHKGDNIYRQPCVISEEKLNSLIKTLESSRCNSSDSFSGNITKKTCSESLFLNIKIGGKFGEKLYAEFFIENDNANIKFNKISEISCMVSSSIALQNATHKSLSYDVLEEKFSRLGDTDFILKSIDISELESNLFLPLSELNEMRRCGIADLLSKLNRHNVEKKEISERFQEDLLNWQFQVSKPEIIMTSAFCASELIICSSINDVKSIRKKEEVLSDSIKLVLKVPLFSEEPIPSESNQNFTEKSIPSVDEYVSFLSKNSTVIPLFQAILFEQDLQIAKSILCLIKNNRSNSDKISSMIVWCENLGLALVASELGFSVILGSNLNITNSHTIAEFSHRLNCCAVVPSMELTCEQVALLKSQVPLVYPMAFEQCLMQSRQCLVRNIPDDQGFICKKQKTDRSCVFNCERVQSIRSVDSNVQLKTIKRTGFYSGVYTQFDARKKEGFNLLQKNITTWFYDLQNYNLHI